MKRVGIAALVLLAVSVSALPAFAQSTPGQAMGTLYLSASGTSYDPNISAQAFVPFTVFMVMELDYTDIGQPALNAGTGAQAWEASLVIPAEFTILSANIRNLSLNVGDNTNLIVGVSPAILANQTAIDLVEYSIGAFSPTINLTDVVLDIGPATPSSFSPVAPGFNENADIGECTTIQGGQPVKCLRPFAQTRSAIINSTSPVEDTSWGAVKGSYSN